MSRYSPTLPALQSLLLFESRHFNARRMRIVTGSLYSALQLSIARRQRAPLLIATRGRRIGTRQVVLEGSCFEQQGQKLGAEQEVVVEAEDVTSQPTLRVDEHSGRCTLHRIRFHRLRDEAAFWVGSIDADREADAVLMDERLERLELHRLVGLEYRLQPHQHTRCH